MHDEKFTEAIERERADLTGYLKRMVVRPAIAEELMQETAVRAWQHRHDAPSDLEIRLWPFRIATNLAIDYLRKRGVLRETLLTDAQNAAESGSDFIQIARSLRGQPEVAAIAREHLTACFACTLGQLSPDRFPRGRGHRRIQVEVEVALRPFRLPLRPPRYVATLCMISYLKGVASFYRRRKKQKNLAR